jgi:hypothetical protein
MILSERNARRDAEIGNAVFSPEDDLRRVNTQSRGVRLPVIGEK